MSSSSLPDSSWELCKLKCCSIIDLISWTDDGRRSESLGYCNFPSNWVLEWNILLNFAAQIEKGDFVFTNLTVNINLLVWIHPNMRKLNNMANLLVSFLRTFDFSRTESYYLWKIWVDFGKPGKDNNSGTKPSRQLLL